MPAYITGLGVCLPNAPVTNDQIENVLGVVNDRPSRLKEVILMRNGIETRYYAIEPTTGRQTHTNAQITAAAIRRLTEESSFALPDIQLLACGTASPDQLVPNHASMVHGLLESPPCELVSTAGVCCSGVVSLKYAYLSVLAETISTAVVTGSELASPVFRGERFGAQIQANLETHPYLSFEEEFLRWMLSDGAGAVLITDRPHEQRPSLRIDWIDIVSFAGELDTCMFAGAVKQSDGSLRTWREESDFNELVRGGYFNLQQDVTVLEKNILPNAFRRSFLAVRDKRQLSPQSTDWLVPHLSSNFFRQPLTDVLADVDFVVPEEKWFTNLSTKGNTGAASIFIMLEELYHSGRLSKGDRLVCVVPESARFTFAYFQLTVV